MTSTIRRYYGFSGFYSPNKQITQYCKIVRIRWIKIAKNGYIQYLAFPAKYITSSESCAEICILPPLFKSFK